MKIIWINVNSSLVKEELMVNVALKDVQVELDNQDQKELQECKAPLVLAEFLEYLDCQDHL